MPKNSSVSKKLSQKNQNDKANYIVELVRGLMQIARHSPERLKSITKEQFISRTVLPSKRLPITFTELKKRAMYELQQIGFCHQSVSKYGPGNYIVVGDCHGKHTRTGIFKLLKTVCDHLKIDRIIHIGHMLDDDNDINYNWNKVNSKISIIAKEEELKFLSKSPILQKDNVEIVTKEIDLGKVSIQNQDLIDDYVQTPLANAIVPDYFDGSTIVNLHRHEMDTRCTPSGYASFIASPGCMCEQHIIYTIKQMDFTDGRTVKLTFPNGYKKYRRMKHMYKTWQQGLIIVHVDNNLDFQLISCRIHQTSKGFTTSYFNRIICEDAIFNATHKNLTIADVHSDRHDVNVLDIIEQVAADYQPDTLINIGDMSDNDSINHHKFKQASSSRFEKDLLDEAYVCNYLMKRFAGWATQSIFMKGNHERFYDDFIMRFPQFKNILDFSFINGLKDLDIDICELKNIKKHFGTNYTHGDIEMFGQKGSNYLDKLYRTYGKNTACGHCHYPSVRHDCYTIGLCGLLNQEYNETEASKWLHGFLIDNSFEDQNFLCTLAIVNNKLIINNKTYTPKNTASWNIGKYSAKVVFESC